MAAIKQAAGISGDLGSSLMAQQQSLAQEAAAEASKSAFPLLTVFLSLEEELPVIKYVHFDVLIIGFPDGFSQLTDS